jgi:hypothetical protein
MDELFTTIHAVLVSITPLVCMFFLIAHGRAGVAEHTDVRERPLHTCAEIFLFTTSPHVEQKRTDTFERP